jgi:tRNA modification GTPase
VKTIAGIATPTGFGGIGIVRLSGADSLQILQKMFLPKSAEKSAAEIAARRATLGTVYGDGFSDTVIAIYFPAPYSFTGENVVEIQAHGGYKLLQKIMQTAISHGAVPATNGEFTKTAFLNGKLSLDEAESIMDIINAESDAEISNAGQIMLGALRTKLNGVENALISARADIDAYLDYPDELPTKPKYNAAIKKIIAQIDGLLATAKTGQTIKNGISVAIIGKPNAGKSSLFNAIINENRSIVTDIAGTTTDTVHEHIIHKGIKIKFTDTAGIRDGKNIIETDGIARAVDAAKKADIVLVVLDATTELNEYDRYCIDIAAEKSPIIVYNKTDIAKINMTALHTNGRIPVSAKTNKNIGLVLDKIVDLTVQMPTAANALLITNERHARELMNSKTALISALCAGTPDMASADITTALNHIGAITGTNVTEATLDEIFSKFCLGK